MEEQRFLIQNMGIKGAAPLSEVRDKKKLRVGQAGLTSDS